MNYNQRNVYEYLSKDGHPERKQALSDLIDRGFFESGVLNQKDVLQKYIDDNPRGFCQDGITRFRKEFDLTPKSPKNRVRVVLDVEVDKDFIAGTATDDGGFIGVFQHKLRGIKVGDRTVVDATWVDYTVKPDVDTFRKTQTGKIVS